jgi:hypothetical protein
VLSVKLRMKSQHTIPIGVSLTCNGKALPFNIRQDRYCTCDAILRHIYVSNVAVKKGVFMIKKVNIDMGRILSGHGLTGAFS